ncbi:MAG: hypothetical protein ABSA49_13205 [Rhizomicrobium sp.]|jgi:hypothetical protein
MTWFDYFVVGAFLVSFGIAVGIFYLSSARPILHAAWLRDFFHFAMHDNRMSARASNDMKEAVLGLTQNYGRVYLALFVTFVIGVLLYLKIITPEAGLPILAGIAGFALGNSPNNSQGSPPAAPGGQIG